jgi:hypothetical protein
VKLKRRKGGKGLDHVLPVAQAVGIGSAQPAGAGAGYAGLLGEVIQRARSSILF